MDIRLTPRQVRFPAMGTTVSILFAGELPPGAAGAVRNLFASWEALLSRFRPESELSRVNRAAGTPTTVRPLLRSVLTVAARGFARRRRQTRIVRCTAWRYC